MTKEEKLQAREQAKNYADLQGIAYVDPHPELDQPETPPTEKVVEDPNKVIPAAIEITDDVLMKELNKRGIQASSLTDFLPKPSEDEIKLATEKRNSQKLAFGLSTGKFNQNEYDAFIKAQENRLEVVKDELVEKIKAANPDFTPDQVAEKLAIYTFANLPQDDILRIQREQELMDLADTKIKNKYANIINLDNDYDQYEQGITNKANFERKVQAALPVYQNDLKTVLGGLSVLETSVNDVQNPANNVPIKVTFSEADLREVEEAFLQPEQIVRQIKAGYTIETIREEAETVLLKKHWQRLLSQAAKDYNSVQKEKYINGRKGLMPGSGEIDISDDSLATSNEALYKELMESDKTPAASSN
jgi:hypothetical protein